MDLLTVDRKKHKWLSRHGVKPVNDDVIQEWIKPFEDNVYLEDARSRFQYYCRIGKTIVMYSRDYLEKTSYRDLRKAHKRCRKHLRANDGVWIRKWIARLELRWMLFRHKLCK